MATTTPTILLNVRYYVRCPNSQQQFPEDKVVARPRDWYGRTLYDTVCPECWFMFTLEEDETNRLYYPEHSILKTAMLSDEVAMRRQEIYNVYSEYLQPTRRHAE
jgi:hypothetical protein